jgi:hypothetical protein
MLDIRVNGSSQTVAEVINSVRDVPARVIPYAASTAMTRVASLAAKTELPAAMRSSFDRPTRWTLNSLAIEPATRDKLSARIFVKNEAAGGVPQENYLLPGVDGGVRREKGFERALRYRGLMRAGESAVPSSSASQDEFGNVRRAIYSKLLNSLGTRGSPYFVGAVGVKKTRGIWERGAFRRYIGKKKIRSVRPIFLFTQKRPVYRARLDFAGVAEMTALKHFGPEFNRAAAAILARPR